MFGFDSLYCFFFPGSIFIKGRVEQKRMGISGSEGGNEGDEGDDLYARRSLECVSSCEHQVPPHPLAPPASDLYSPRPKSAKFLGWNRRCLHLRGR